MARRHVARILAVGLTAFVAIGMTACNAQSQRAQYLLVANEGLGLPGMLGNLAEFRIDARTGALVPVQGSPFTAGSVPDYVAVDPSGTLAYVASKGLWAFRIDAGTGALTPIASAPFLQSTQPDVVIFNKTGTCAYAVLTSGVMALRVDRSGAPAAVGGAPVPNYGNHPRSAVIDRSGTLLYVADRGRGGGGGIAGYRANPQTCALKPISQSLFATGNAPRGMAMSKSGDLLYVAKTENQGVSAYHVDTRTGTLSPVSGSPFSAGGHVATVAVAPGGGVLYAATFQPAAVAAFRIDRRTGVLTPITGSPFSNAEYVGESDSIAINQQGTLLYGVDRRGGNVFAFHIDPGTGELKPVQGGPNSGPNLVSVAMAQP